MKRAKQSFGGDWTTEKLKRLRKYLAAYTTAMKNQRYQIVYLDAFAGTGYRTSPKEMEADDYLFPEVVKRLKTVFPGVAEKPLPLLNSRNNPLYLLCFAVSNPAPRAKGLALEIARSVLRR